MYLIRIFADFLKNEDIKPIFEDRFTTSAISKFSKDGNIQITDKDDYTHVIIINTAMPKIKPNIPKENVIGLAYEPIPFLNITYEFVQYAEKNIGKYFIGDLYGLLLPFTENIAYLTYSVPIWKIKNISINSIIKEKKKNISIMISNKTIAPGHLYREQMVIEILKSNLPIDIYGNGCSRFQQFYNDNRLKGTFIDNEPYLDYKFHISIENFQSNYYFSEKIINPLLYGTIPIYLGCHNIESFLPENSIIKLKNDVNKDMILLNDIIYNPEKYDRTIDVEKIENSMNLFKNIDKIFS